MELNEMQKRAWENKVKKGFNTTNVFQEFCYLYGEIGEAYEAFIKKHDDLGGELADIALYLLGLSEMLGFNLKDEIEKKIEINEHRQYVNVNGVLVKKDSEDDIH